MNYAIALQENKQTISYMQHRYCRNIEPDEIQQICRMTIADGLEKWDSSKSNIKTYMLKKMNGQIRNKLREKEALKRLGVSCRLENVNPNVIALMPQQEDKLRWKEYVWLLIHKSSSIEKQVLMLIYRGYNGEEIAPMIGRTKQCVEQIRKRIGKNFKQILNIERLQIAGV